VPTVFDNASETQFVEGAPTSVSFWDTAGESDYDRLRPLSYPQTDVFLLCFALDGDESRANVESKWLPELKHHAAGVPVVVAATKADLISSRRRRTDAQLRVDDDRNAGGDLVVDDDSVYGYFECSALEEFGVNEVFDHTLRVGLWHRRWLRHQRRQSPLRRLLSFSTKKKKTRQPPPAFKVFRIAEGDLAQQQLECAICLETGAADLRKVACCKKRFCASCLERYVADLAASGSVFLQCPNAHCSRLLNRNTVKAWGGPAAFETYERNLATNHARHLAAVRSNSTFAPGFRGTKVCPHCKVIIERSLGCHNMTCKCGFCFDWNHADAVF